MTIFLGHLQNAFLVSWEQTIVIVFDWWITFFTVPTAWNPYSLNRRCWLSTRVQVSYFRNFQSSSAFLKHCVCRDSNTELWSVLDSVERPKWRQFLRTPSERTPCVMRTNQIVIVLFLMGIIFIDGWSFLEDANCDDEDKCKRFMTGRLVFRGGCSKIINFNIPRVSYRGHAWWFHAYFWP